METAMGDAANINVQRYPDDRPVRSRARAHKRNLLRDRGRRLERSQEVGGHGWYVSASCTSQERIGLWQGQRGIFWSDLLRAKRSDEVLLLFLAGMPTPAVFANDFLDAAARLAVSGWIEDGLLAAVACEFDTGKQFESVGVVDRLNKQPSCEQRVTR